MKKADYKTLLQKVLLFLLILMIPVFFAGRELFIGFAQIRDKNEKEIKKASFSFPNEPVEIVSAGNSKNLVRLNEKFSQDMDWLKGFKVIVKNKFNKNITYMFLSIEFPETASSGNIMIFPLSYGNYPAFAIKNESEVAVKPEKTVEIALTEKNYERLKSFIETRHLLDDLSKVEVRVGIILFEDGTGWSAGTLVRPDPNDPKKFIPIDFREIEDGK